MVRLLHPIRLRQVIIVKRAFSQKPKMAKKNCVQIYDKKQQNISNNETQQKAHRQISGKKSYELSISKSGSIFCRSTI